MTSVADSRTLSGCDIGSFDIRQTPNDPSKAVSKIRALVSVDLDALIERVYVSPLAKNTFEAKVRSIMKEHGLQDRVFKSDLAREPLC